MIKPELHEVHEYFKDAIIIRSISGTEFENTNDFRYSIFNHNSGIYTQDGMREVWNERQGYAKILSYKTPMFEISREQILNLHGNAKAFGCSSVEYRLKEWFPEAFKVKVDYNKPLLSLNDLLSVWGDINEVELYKTAPLFKNFRELAKSKTTQP